MVRLADLYSVDRRETMDEEKPFASAKRETDGDAILGILKLFGEYEDVAEQEKPQRMQPNVRKPSKMP